MGVEKTLLALAWAYDSCCFARTRCEGEDLSRKRESMLLKAYGLPLAWVGTVTLRNCVICVVRHEN